VQGGNILKRKIVFWIEITAFFMAIVLLLMGIVIGSRIYAYLDGGTEPGGSVALVGQMRLAAIYSIVSSVMVIAGTAILLYLGLKLFWKTRVMERETEVLRSKNEAIAKVIRQTRELAHHQRLQTIGMLTSSIAHEFNNLLTPIMGYSLMTLEKLQPEQELYDDILEIYESSCKAKEIISRLNDLSRKNTDTSFRHMSPDVLIRKTISIAKPAKADNVQIKLDLNCDDQRINANEIQFTQLLLNLILNAFHAMDDGGTLSVRTSFDEEHVHISISDTGCGMTSEVQKKIFEPFFTTKETGRGTGLGLAIVAQAIEDHRGKILVNSKVGEGTTFHIRLPRIALKPES
jgi:signal transduction histidine kinase